MTTDTPDTARLGELLRDGDRVGLRFVRRLAHPPEKVWSALTESEHLRHWFPADIVGERRSGAPLTLPFWPESVDRGGEELAEMGIDPADAVLAGELVTWDPPRLLELTWDTDRLRYELHPDDAGTRLVFTTWLLGPQGPKGLPGTAAGYHTCFDQLEELLDTGSARPVDLAAVAALEERYAAATA